MPGKDIAEAAPKLPESFWDAVQVTVVNSSEQYPLITLALVLTFILLFAWGGVAIHGFVTIRRDKIKYDYEGKKLKADIARERFRSKQRQLKGPANKTIPGASKKGP